MKIALMSWESLHSVPVGGVANHVTELAAALERREHEVHVFVRMGEGQGSYDLIHGVHYHRVAIQLHPDFIEEMNNMSNAMIWSLGEVEASYGPFDIVHGHDWLAAKTVVQAKNDRGKKTVFTMHSTEYGRCGNVWHQGKSDRVRAYEAEGMFVADRVITVSGRLADEVKAHYQIPDWKLRTVYNGIHCERYDGDIDPSVCRATYGIGPMDPMVLFVGRLSVQKGPDILLDAIPHILAARGDTKIVFVGDGDMRKDLEWKAGELGIQHACRFVGSMSPDSDLKNLFKSCDCVCVPSRNEPFGIVILEAWASGKPVVATHNGGPGEFVSHGETGYLVYDHAGSVAWGVSQIFNNFTHAKWMGERGRVTAAFGFSWDKIAEETEGIYKELM